MKNFGAPMQYPSLHEARKYVEELPPARSSVYSNGSVVYSNCRRVVLRKECAIEPGEPGACGVLPVLGLFWRATGQSLLLYDYTSSRVETIAGFSSNVQHVKVFEPRAGCFDSRVRFCLFVATACDAFLYAIDGNAVVSTDFTARLRSPVVGVAAADGRVFVGCEDGCLYEAVYGCIELLGYRYMSMQRTRSMLSGMFDIFRKRRGPVRALAAGKRHVVVVGDEIEVYWTAGGLNKEQSIAVDDEYVAVEIVEDSPLFFYCVLRNGRRDFFTAKKMHSRDFPVSLAAYESNREGIKMVDGGALPNETVLRNRAASFKSTPDAILGWVSGDASHFVLTTFNAGQLRNFSRTRPVENFETFTVYAPARAAAINGNQLAVLCDRKVAVYEVLDDRRFLATCSTADARLMLQSLGEVEFQAHYYALLAEHEDVGRLEGMVGNGCTANHALFVCLYRMFRPIFYKPLAELHCAPLSDEADAVVSRLRSLSGRIGRHCAEAAELIEEVCQAYGYTLLLRTYGVVPDESLASIVCPECSNSTIQAVRSVATDSDDFRATSLRALLAAVPHGQSIEPLLKALKSRCPRFLPLEQVSRVRGLDLLAKESGAFLEQSLECFKDTAFDRNVVQRYCQLGFYYGAVVLIRDNAALGHEETVSLLGSAVRCRRAMDAGLRSTRDTFLYPFFEVLLGLTEFTACRCCDAIDTPPNLLTIEHPAFEPFLRDRAARSRCAADLHWKYLLARARNAAAVNAIIAICAGDRLFTEKVALLQVALTIAAAIGPAPGEAQSGDTLHASVKLMLRLAAIQSELMDRDPSRRTARLLSADELFNDHCGDHPDLGLRVLDAIGFADPQVHRDLYARAFADLSLAQALAFLTTIINKDLGLVLDLLIPKTGDLDFDFCERLVAAGFRRSEVIAMVSEAVHGAYHPDVRDRLSKAVERCARTLVEQRGVINNTVDFMQ